MAVDSEQHFILRVQDAELANRLRGWLRDTAHIDGDVRLLFEQQNDREGVLTVDGVDHKVVLQNLPAVIESYKTLDDANLVKVADIGQVLLVVDPALATPGQEELGYYAKDGVTPPMRKARSRHFKPTITLPQPHMREAVNDVLEILAGRAPEGYSFHDIEEEYVIDPATGQGKWQQVKPSKQQRAAAAAAATETAAKSSRATKTAKGRSKANEDSADEDVSMTESDE